MALSKKRESYLRRCREQIESAKAFRKDEGLDDLWERLIDLYRGKHFPKGLSNDDRFVVNVCFSTINVIGPSISVNYPKITVNATNAENEDRAIIMEAVVNYWWRHYDIKPEFRSAVKDSLIVGFGWLKTGYRFVEEEVEDQEKYEQELSAAIAEADEFAATNPELAGELPTDDEIAANVTGTSFQVVEDRPFVERVSPFDVFVDPEATSLANAKWVAQKIVRELEEVRADDSYKPTGRRDVEADEMLKREWRGPRFRDKDHDGVKRVTVWEFYDLRKGTMCVFSEKGADFLVDPVDQPYVFGHPFVMIRNYDVPDQFYPMGELEALEPLQHELNMTRTAMFNDRKQFRRKWLANPKAFDRHARGQLESDEDNVVVMVNGNTPLDEAIIPMPANQVNPQLFQDSQVIENDLTNISGVNEYMRGALPEIRRTATEASIIQDAANARAADKLAQVEWVIAEVASRLTMLAQQYMTEEQQARIMGANSAPVWFDYTPEDIQGEFHFEVEAGSTQPKNEAQRRQTAMQMLQTLGPLGDPSGQAGIVNLRELVAYCLQYGFGVKDPGRFLNDPIGPRQGMGMSPDDIAAADPESAPPGGAAPAPVEGAPPVDGGGAIPPELMAMMGQ